MRRALRSRATLAVLAVGAAAIATSAALAASSPVPRSEQQRIVALFGRTYLPTFLPRGYIYANWKSEPGSATVYGNSLILSFGKRGDLLQWTVGSSQDPDGYAQDACSAHPFGAHFYRVGRRRIVYQSGNHGTTSTLCLGSLAVVVWNGHTLPPLTLARFVASARAVG